MNGSGKRYSLRGRTEGGSHEELGRSESGLLLESKRWQLWRLRAIVFWGSLSALCFPFSLLFPLSVFFPPQKERESFVVWGIYKRETKSKSHLLFEFCGKIWVFLLWLWLGLKEEEEAERRD